MSNTEKIKSIMNTAADFLKIIPLEVYIWTTALIFLAAGNFSGETHFSICPFKLIGIDFCPGCGLGRSVSLFLHGRLLDSFHIHWLGPIAALMLIYRIISLVKYSFKKYKLSIIGKA